MLDEYFGMKVDEDGNLSTLPLLLREFTISLKMQFVLLITTYYLGCAEKFEPDVNDMPLFVWRLMTEVNWRDEKECFWGICSEIAKFYAEAVKKGDVKGDEEVRLIYRMFY